MIIAILVLIVVIAVLVLAHEWGHFVVARRNGITVEEFGFGFPPRLFSKKRSGVVYSFNALPLGGFVKLKGESSGSTTPGSFGAASFGAQARTLLAGVGMNALIAYLLLVVLAVTGLPRLIDGQFKVGHPTYAQAPTVIVASVETGSPAAQLGLKSGDQVISGNGNNFATERDLVDFTTAHAGQKVSLKVKEAGTVRIVLVTLGNDPNKGHLGVVPFASYSEHYGWWAPIEALGLFGQLVWATLLAFKNLVVGLFVHAKISADVAGPVGIAVILQNLIHFGASYVLAFVASISISLAILNVLPLPALDGGRLAIIGAQKITGRRLSDRAEAMIHAAGFVVLIALMAVITYFDIKRF